jgi:hypothetical protein
VRHFEYYQNQPGVGQNQVVLKEVNTSNLLVSFTH